MWFLFFLIVLFFVMCESICWCDSEVLKLFFLFWFCIVGFIVFVIVGYLWMLWWVCLFLVVCMNLMFLILWKDGLFYFLLCWELFFWWLCIFERYGGGIIWGNLWYFCFCGGSFRGGWWVCVLGCVCFLWFWMWVEWGGLWVWSCGIECWFFCMDVYMCFFISVLCFWICCLVLFLVYVLSCCDGLLCS